MTEHTLSAERLHFAWNNRLAPVLEIEPGDSVTFEMWDASGHFYTPASTGADVDRRRREPSRGHALTGPLAIHGARSGQTLVIDVLEVAPARWGYTAFGPGRGLLPDDFQQSYLRVWDLSDGQFGRGSPGVRVPLSPFCGVMGVAPLEPASHSTAPPRRTGSNMDVRQRGQPSCRAARGARRCFLERLRSPSPRRTGPRESALESAATP